MTVLALPWLGYISEMTRKKSTGLIKTGDVPRYAIVILEMYVINYENRNILNTLCCPLICNVIIA